MTEPPHAALYWRFGAQMAIRKGDWKLVKYDPAVEGGPDYPHGIVVVGVSPLLNSGFSIIFMNFFNHFS